MASCSNAFELKAVARRRATSRVTVIVMAAALLAVVWTVPGLAGPTDDPAKPDATPPAGDRTKEAEGSDAQGERAEAGEEKDAKAGDKAGEDDDSAKAGRQSDGKQPTRRVQRRPVRRARNQFEPDPNAKFAVDRTAVELEPVWDSKKTLTFEFNIRNEGTADLRIRARGG